MPCSIAGCAEVIRGAERRRSAECRSMRCGCWARSHDLGAFVNATFMWACPPRSTGIELVQRIGARVHLRFVVPVADVGAHRFDAQPQPLGDLLVAIPLSELLQHLAFTFAQQVDLLGGFGRSGEAAGIRRAIPVLIGDPPMAMLLTDTTTSSGRESFSKYPVAPAHKA